jgi:hypothetical protein
MAPSATELLSLGGPDLGKLSDQYEKNPEVGGTWYENK